MPIDSKLAAEPLQSVEAHLLEQSLGGLDTLTQAPPNNVFKLLQR